MVSEIIPLCAVRVDKCAFVVYKGDKQPHSHRDNDAVDKSKHAFGYGNFRCSAMLSTPRRPPLFLPQHLVNTRPKGHSLIESYYLLCASFDSLTCLPDIPATQRDITSSSSCWLTEIFNHRLCQIAVNVFSVKCSINMCMWVTRAP